MSNHTITKLASVLCEKVNDTTLRMITFDHDEDTGFKSISDIIEISRDTPEALANLAAQYAWVFENSEEIQFVNGDEVDFGLARTVAGKIRKYALHTMK